MRLSGRFLTLFFLRKILQNKETQNKQKVTNKTKTSKYKTTKAIIFCKQKLLREWKLLVLCFFMLQDFFLKKIRWKTVLIASFTILLSLIMWPRDMQKQALSPPLLTVDTGNLVYVEKMSEMSPIKDQFLTSYSKQNFW